MADGQYRIQVTLVPGEVVSPGDQGSDDSIDSNVDGRGISSLFDVVALQLYDIDAGLYPMSGGGGD